MSAIGLLLVLVGATLFVAEAHVPSHGALGTAAAAPSPPGSACWSPAPASAPRRWLGATLAAALVSLALVLVIVRKGLATRRHPRRGGAEGLIGRLGEVRAAPAPVGRVFVDGALWRARRWDLEGEPDLRPGDPVVIEQVSGLTLTVRPAEEWEVAP